MRYEFAPIHTNYRYALLNVALSHLPHSLTRMHVHVLYICPNTYHLSVPMPALSGRCNHRCGRLHRSIDHYIGGFNNYLLQVSIDHGH